jgi:uncharacterized membrane protein
VINRSAPRDRESTSRIEALSDNIFAVAMTLLVLDIKVPMHGNGRDLWPFIAPLWHHVRTFAVSFFIVGLYWVLHHHVFVSIRRSDRTLLWLNLLFMLFVVITPFSTGLLGAFDDSRTAVIVYGLNVMVLGLSLQAIWLYATHGHRLVGPQLEARVVRSETWHLFIMPSICVLAIAASFFSTTTSIGIYIVAPFLHFLPVARETAKPDAKLRGERT